MNALVYALLICIGYFADEEGVERAAPHSSSGAMIMEQMNREQMNRERMNRERMKQTELSTDRRDRDTRFEFEQGPPV